MKKKLIIFFRTPVLTGILAVVASQSYAQSNNQLLRSEIEALKQRIAVLERKLELADKEAEKKKSEGSRVYAGPSGIAIESSDKQHRLSLHGLVQADSRAFLSDRDINNNDTFLLRRARAIFRAKFYENWEFNLQTEFGGSSVSVLDANINANYFKEFQVRAGKFKSPVGLESLQSDPNRLFNETSLVTNLVPNRDVGVQLHGKIADDLIQYQLGLFNGAPDGANALNQDFDDERELAARIFFHPFKKTAWLPLQNFGVGMAYSVGNKDGEGGVPRYRTDGQATFLSFQTNVIADGEHTRFSPQGYWYWNNFGLLGEYVRTEQRFRQGASTFGDFTSDAWHIAAAWVITGEDVTYNGVRPKNPFNPWHKDSEQRGWGAFELTARYAYLKTQSDRFNAFTTAGSAQRAAAWGLGVNWYLNDNVRIGINYFNTDFAGINDAPNAVTNENEEAIITRLQFNF